MADIFISYAKEDLARVEPLATALAEYGWSIWWDRTIPAGRTWREVIGEALESARSVIVLWSKTSVKSRWVHEEADWGLERKILIPILIDEVRPPLGFGSVQAADLLKWDPTQSSPNFDKLVFDISAILGPSPRHVGGTEQAAEKGRKRTQEEERKREEEERRKAEEKRELKEEHQRAEAERKAEEERKRKEIEAKRKAEEELKRKQAEDEAERARKEQVERKAEHSKSNLDAPGTPEQVSSAFALKPLTPDISLKNQNFQESTSGSTALNQALDNVSKSNRPGVMWLLMAAIISGGLGPIFVWVLLPLIIGVDWWSYVEKNYIAIPHLRAGSQLMLNNTILAAANVIISSLVAFRGFIQESKLAYTLPVSAAFGLAIATFFQLVLDLAALGGWEAILLHNFLFSYSVAILWFLYQLIRKKNPPVMDGRRL